MMSFFKNKKAVHGHLVKVKNKYKKAVESEFHFALWVENKFDDDEQCLLFSQSDLSKIQTMTFCDFISIMDFGKLYRMGNAKSYFIKINGLDKQEKVVRLNKTIFENGVTRAGKHPEDIPTKTFIQDLLD
jgi:hypothetical protein